MPLLIGGLLVGLAVFHHKSRQAPGKDGAGGAQAALSPLSDAPERSPELAPAPAPQAGTPPPVIPEAPSTAPTSPASAQPPRPQATSESPATATPLPPLAESDFTPWMSPLALDTYLRQKGRGQPEGFWAQGYWIRAIEGRWNGGEREFRVALATRQNAGLPDWNYRIDLTQSAFAEAFHHFAEEGYELIHHQAYRHPDGTLRYQAVWKRSSPSPEGSRQNPSESVPP